MKRLIALALTALWLGTVIGASPVHANWATTDYTFPP